MLTRPRLLTRFTDLFDALADPTRAQLVLLLLEGEKRSGELAFALDKSPSAISHQLRWLREHHVVADRKVGREVYYQLADACITEIVQVVLRHIQEEGL